MHYNVNEVNFTIFMAWNPLLLLHSANAQSTISCSQLRQRSTKWIFAMKVRHLAPARVSYLAWIYKVHSAHRGAWTAMAD